MLLENLSSQERQLYGLIGLACAAALVLGLLGGLISFSWGNKERADNWRASVTPSPADTLKDFTDISSRPRWFTEAGPATAAQNAEAARKAIEGQPESMKLIGVVGRNGHTYALFMPVSPSSINTESPRGVQQFEVGQTLVGDWTVKEINPNKVIVATKTEGADQQSREILLYGAKK
jgi:hypothetical protein